MNKLLKYILILITFISISNAEDVYDKLEYFKLDNGMQVYLLPNEKLKNTKIVLTVGVGLSVETNENTGISHLTEHLMFRDKRIPHNNYLTYIKEEGATYMNGYTDRYETGYVGIIDSNKSYWIVDQFYNMIFDKKITDKNLFSERGAVQTELGEYDFIEIISSKLTDFFISLSPKKEDKYKIHFNLKDEQDFPKRYLQKLNNQTITMKEVMNHYHTYYYPENMILKVVGNFDINKMKELIINKFGSIKLKGTKKSKKPLSNPVSNNKPYILFKEGSFSNYGLIGAKYIETDYKKHMIVDAYLNYLAVRLQEKLRNKNGATYSISNATISNRKGVFGAIYFDGLSEHFENNIKVVNQMINDDRTNLSTIVIKESLRRYSILINNIEYDTATFMKLIGAKQYLIEENNIFDKSFTDLFETITIKEFETTIKEVFVDKNKISNIFREYTFFKYDNVVIQIILYILSLLIYFKMYMFGMKCKQRSFIINRRISNRFLGFLYVFIFVFFFTFLVEKWISYFIFDYLLGNPSFLEQIDIPYSFIVSFIYFIITMGFFLALCRYVFPYYSRFVLTEDRICITGHKVKYFLLSEISSINVSKWNILNGWKSYGMSILFWKPLLEITLNDGKKIYFRSSNAEHLKEDIESN